MATLRQLSVLACAWLASTSCRSEAARSPAAAGPARNVAGATPSEEEASEPAPPPENTETAPAPIASAPSEPSLAVRYGTKTALSSFVGSASYYADSLAGHATASGVPYDPRGFTAAHRTLPLGSVLRVSRQSGGRAIYVQVNDRGPYGPRGRVLDLSGAAAEALGILRLGVAKVRVEVVAYGPSRKRRR